MKKEELQVLFLVIMTIFLTIFTSAIMIMLAVK